MAGKEFQLKVISPDRQVFDGPAVGIRLPGPDGYLGVLYNHAPLISLIGTGELSVQGPNGGEPTEMFIANGFFQVKDNDVTLVCDAGEPAEEIDLERAQEAEKRARERLEQAIKKGFDRPRASAALRRSLLRQGLAGRRKKRTTGLR